MLIARHIKTKEICLFPEYRLIWKSMWENYELLAKSTAPLGIKASFKDNFSLKSLIDWNKKRQDKLQDQINKLKSNEKYLKEILKKYGQ